jgi:hypothetical protein
MRETCLDCCRKHLGAAMVLMDEARLGYPLHRWLAVGHMVEAESETLELYPVLAASIRQERTSYMAGEGVNLMELINEAEILSRTDVSSLDT